MDNALLPFPRHSAVIDAETGLTGVVDECCACHIIAVFPDPLFKTNRIQFGREAALRDLSPGTHTLTTLLLLQRPGHNHPEVDFGAPVGREII